MKVLEAAAVPNHSTGQYGNKFTLLTLWLIIYFGNQLACFIDALR